MINDGRGAHRSRTARRFQNERVLARTGMNRVDEAWDAAVDESAGASVRVASKADAALALHFSGIAVRVVASDGHARSQRRCESACVLPASRGASLRDGDADGGDDGEGRAGRDADADRADDLPAVPWVCAREFGAISCVDCTCGEFAGAAGAVAHGFSRATLEARLRPLQTHAGRGPPDFSQS